MYKKFAAALLALAIALTCSVSALALPTQQAYRFGSLSGICADNDSLLVTDVFNKVVWRFTDSEAARVAGRIGVADINGIPIGDYADGTALTAAFKEPWAVARFLNGFAVTDAEANVVRFFDDKAVQTIAGSGKEGHTNGTGTGASFYRPTGLAAGPDGTLFVADTGNNCIRRIDTQGKVTTWFSGLSEPTGICWANDALYVAETGSSCVSMISNGSKTVLAGRSGTVGFTDGPADKSLLRSPMGVAVGADGTVYIADTGNGAVRQIKNGRVTTLASNQQTPEAPAQPRSILVQGTTLLVTDTMANTILPLSTAAPAFSDVAPASVFAPYITAAAERGITGGVGGGQFAPNRAVTRAMFVTMLARMHHSTDGDVVIDGSIGFPDVANGSWCERSVKWAAEQKITQGNNGRFLPDSGITRQALVTMLYRYAQQNGYPTSARADLSRFKDAAQVSDFAKDAVSWAVSLGLLSGDANGNLNPGGTATRAHTVKFLIAFMDANKI